MQLRARFFYEFQESVKEYRREPGRKARQLLRRATTKNRTNPYRYFNGERMVQFYSDKDLYQFSGSSINRILDEKRKKAEGGGTPEVETPANVPELFELEKGSAEGAGHLAGGVNRQKRRVHVLSARSKQKIREKTGAFFRVRGRTSTFVTLSFIDAVSDKLAVTLLNKFFVQLRKAYGDFQYIWVIERQKENKKFPDNPHFHIVIDRRLSIDRWNSLWVLQQYNAGLQGWSEQLGRCLTAEEVDLMHRETMRLLREFRSEKDKARRAVIQEKIEGVRVGRFLNPFDIKKIKTIDGLSLYLTKYISKNNDEYECSTWRCSRGVSRLFTKMAASYDLWVAAGTSLNTYVDKETGEYFEPKVVEVWPKIKCKETGKVIEKKVGYPVATIIYILNKKYFGQYMSIVDRINKWVLKGFEPDIRRMTYDEYLSRCHNFKFLN